MLQLVLYENSYQLLTHAESLKLFHIMTSWMFFSEIKPIMKLYLCMCVSTYVYVWMKCMFMPVDNCMCIFVCLNEKLVISNLFKDYINNQAEVVVAGGQPNCGNWTKPYFGRDIWRKKQKTWCRSQTEYFHFLFLNRLICISTCLVISFFIFVFVCCCIKPLLLININFKNLSWYN